MLLCAVSLSGLTACSKKPEEPPVKTAAAKAEKSPAFERSAMIDAMMRSHPNSTRICIDQSRENTFYLDYGPLLRADDEDFDKRMNGWYFIEDVEFYKAPNNTLFNTAMNEDRYVRIYPNVEGMHCRMTIKVTQ